MGKCFPQQCPRSPKTGLLQSKNCRSKIDKPTVSGKIQNSQSTRYMQSLLLRYSKSCTLIDQYQIRMNCNRQRDGIRFARIESLTLASPLVSWILSQAGGS